MITPYLTDLINDHKNIRNSEWKIQLNMGVNFISTNDRGEEKFVLFMWIVIMKRLDWIMKHIW